MLIYVKVITPKIDKQYTFEELYKKYLKKYGELEYKKIKEEINALDWFLNPRMYEDNNFIEELLKDKEENEKGGDFLKVYSLLKKVYGKSENIVFKNIQNIMNTITKIISIQEYNTNKSLYKILGFKSRKDGLLYVYNTNQIIIENTFDIRMYYKNTFEEIKGTNEKYKKFGLDFKKYLENLVL